MKLPQDVYAELSAFTKRDATLRKLGIVKIEDHAPDIDKWYFHRRSEYMECKLEDAIETHYQIREDVAKTIKESKRKITEVTTRFKRFEEALIREMLDRQDDVARLEERCVTLFDVLKLQHKIDAGRTALEKYLYKKQKAIERARKEISLESDQDFSDHVRCEREGIRRARECERQSREQNFCEIVDFEEIAKRPVRRN